MRSGDFVEEQRSQPGVDFVQDLARDSKSWLLVGGNSEIGAATRRHLARLLRPAVSTTRRPDSLANGALLLDLSAPLDAWEPPEGTSAACIFVATARLAACHADPRGSAHINVIQTLALIKRLIARDVFVLFLFDQPGLRWPEALRRRGQRAVSSERVWSAEGARRVRAARHDGQGAPLALLRLAKVLSPRAPLLQGWMQTLSAGGSVAAFQDMRMAPTPVEMVAASITRILDERRSGIFQFTGPCDVSYLEVGRYIARRIGADPELVLPARAAAAGLPEGSTPHHTTLDSTRLRELYDIAAPGPWEAIESVIANR